MENKDDKYRMRINVSQSVKGILTFDCTVEMETTDGDTFRVYEKSKQLVKLLESKYDVEHQKRMLNIS